MTQPRSRSISGRLLLGVLLGVLVMVGMGIYADGRALLRSLTRFQWLMLAPVLGLTLVNYLLRFAKWHYYLHALGHRVPWRDSALVFLGGFSMSITPGKFGELLKAWLLRDRCGTPAADTASVVIAERATDFFALVLLATTGVLSSQHGVAVLLIAALGSVFFLGLVASERLSLGLIDLLGRLPGGSVVAPRLEAVYRSIAALLRPKPLAATTVLSVAAWFCECVGFYLVLTALPDTAPALGTATFVYAFATIFGAVTMLPGGLGATEGSLIGLSFGAFGLALTREASTAAALLIRFCTLWFAVLVGLVALGWLRRRGPITATEEAAAG